MGALDVNSVFNASAQIMAPYPTTTLTIVLSEITTDQNSVATVIWSRPYNGATPLAPGPYTMPTGLAQPNTSYILVQTTYQYNPVVGANYIPTIPMTDQLFMIPRASSSIPYTG